MKYVNISSERKLVSVGQKRRWINPMKSVELSQKDIKALGLNSRFIKKESEAKDFFINAQKKEERIERSKRLKRKFAYRAKKRAIIAKRNEEQKSKVNRGVKKVVKKISNGIETRKQRSLLKKALDGKNKSILMTIGKNIIESDVNTKDKKDAIINKILKASKVVGYEKILKKVNK